MGDMDLPRTGSGPDRTIDPRTGFSPDLFPILFDAAPFGAALVDPRGCVVRSNPALQRILGLNETELARVNFADITHPDDLELDADLFRQAMRGERNHYTIEKRYRHRSGRTVWAKLAVTMIRGEGREPLYCLSTVTDITLQIESDERLKREKGKLALVAATAPGVFCSFRRTFEGRTEFESYSPRLEEILGVSEHEIGNDAERLWQTVHPDDLPRLRAALQHSARTLTAWTDEYRLAHPQRGEIWISTHFQPAREIGGGTIWYGFLVDATERKRRESALRESERRLATLVSNLPGAAFRCLNDPDWTMEFISPGIERMTGYAAADLIDNRDLAFADLIHPEDQARVWNYIQAAIGDEGRYQIEYRLVHRDGSVRHVLEHGVAVGFENGRWTYLEGYLADITPHREAQLALLASEEALRAREEQYRLLTENTLDVIWTLNMDQEFTFLNQSLHLLTGHSPEEWLGTKLRDHFDDENYALMLERIEQELRKGPASGGTIFEAELLRRDGTPVPVEIRGSLVFDERGDPIGLQGTTRDISERRRQQAQHDALREQLLQSQKMEAVGRLAGGVAHDFNNMLTVIGNYSDLVLGKLAPEDPARADVERIRRAADRAATLTQQLLAFSRKQIIRPVLIDINEAVEHAGDMMRRLIGEDIDLVFTPVDAAAHVVFDPGQVEQILLNLAVNSRDAMPHGGKLTIETAIVELDAEYVRKHPHAAPGRYVMLAVSDSGCGMDQATLARVFEPFFTTKRADEGTGLGLSTVYGIVKQHGGAIEIYSEVGHGTTVKIYLPHSPAGPLPAAAEAPPPLRGGAESILLVEDDPAVRLVTARILRSQGYRVIETATAGEAIAAAEDREVAIDLMVSDVVMPGMSGPECYAEVKRRRPELPILYVSGYTENAIAHRGVLDEGIDFIHKPFTLEAIARKVREILDRG